MPQLSTPMPLVSVIIPAHNAARYLIEALNSARAQTYTNWEIIVVDDGSSDETGRIGQEQSDVRYHRQNQQGAGSARNRGVSLARGELLCFLDADDLWSPDKLETQVKFFVNLPPSSCPTLVYAHASEFFSPELDAQSRAAISLVENRPAFLATTLLVTPANFAAVGPYSALLGECIEWHLRSLEIGANVHILPETMLFRRIHSTNISRTRRGDKHDYVRILKASLDRRRAKGVIS